METLSNGLRILVHQRSRVPVVASQMVYRIGAGDDPPGCRGLAHLLEHLTFQGTANFPKGEIERFVHVNGGMANAYTDHDQTAYNFAVPSEKWRDILAIEADRMAGCTFPQEEFRRERDVVLAELRETMDDPWERIAAASDARFFGSGHPYAHPVLGTEEDLKRITLSTVREVYRRAYCPNRAILVLTGDVSAPEVFAEARRLFGAIPPGSGEPLPVSTRIPPAGRMPQYVEMSAAVHQERFWLCYPAPARLAAEYPAMLVLDYLLTSGETALLWDHIVERRRVAADVLSNYAARTRAGNFTIFGDVASGRSSQQVIAAIDEALYHIADKGPDVPSLIKAKNQLYSTWVYELDTAADIGEMLAEAEALLGNHRLGFLQLQAIREVSGEEVRDLARRMLAPHNRYVCILRPEEAGACANASTDHDDESTTEMHLSQRRQSGINLVGSGRVAKTPVPQDEEPPAAVCERVQVHGLTVAIARLANGLEVACVEHPNRLALATRLDICHLGMRQPPSKAGLCSLLGDMLIEGTRRHCAVELKNQLDEHGMQLSTSPSGVGLRALTHNAEEAIALLAEIVQHPTFPVEALARRREDHLTALRVALDSPEQQAKRALTKRLFPSHHPYGHLVTADTLTEIRHHDLVDFHERWFRPNGARLVIAGGLPIRRQLQLVERHFADWHPATLPPLVLPPLNDAAPEPDPVTVPMPTCSGTSVHLGHLGIRRNSADFAALRVMDHILGLGAGQTDRLSHELRDQMGITYHVSASITQSAGIDRGAFSASLNTSPDKVPVAIERIAAHMRRMQDEPINSGDLEAVKAHLRSAFVFGTEGLCSTVRLLATTLLHDLGLDYLERHKRELEAVTVDDVQRVAQTHLKPDALHTAIAGRLATAS